MAADGRKRLMRSEMTRVAALQNRNEELVVACEAGHMETVHALIAAGADINQQRGDGVTPLLAACGEEESREALVIARTERI